MGKEKEVELKVKADKISEEHLKQVQFLINNVNGNQFNIGKIEAQKHKLLHTLTTLQDRVNAFQDMLVKTYGSFDVNIEDGTINWPKDEK